MKTLLSCARLVLAGALLLPALAHAQMFRAYLSAQGLDTNPCTLAYPCRLLPTALNAVAPGGEIWMLDSANYNAGTVFINKSVSILAIPGEVGSISSLGGAAAVSITSPVDVTLRNVVIANNALSPGTHGIYVNGANSVTIENSVITDIQHEPIWVNGVSRVRVKDTVIRNSQEESIWALDGAIVDVIHCKLVGSAYGGITAQASISGRTTLVNVSDSIISARGTALGFGVFAYADPGATTRVYVTRSTIFQTQSALRADGAGSAAIEVSGSMVVRNHKNVDITGSGIVRSLGDNHISDGEVADSGSLTSLGPR